MHIENADYITNPNTGRLRIAASRLYTMFNTNLNTFDFYPKKNCLEIGLG